MTDTIEHGRAQAGDLLNTAIQNYDFGTNTGRSLLLRDISSPEVLAQEFPGIAGQVFPMDKWGNIIAYRPGGETEGSILRAKFEAERFNEINPVSVNEREVTNWTQDAPVIVESPINLPPIGIVNTIKDKWKGASAGEKLASVGVGASLLRFL